MRSLLLLAAAGCSSGSSERVYSLDELPVREWTLGLPVSGDGTLRVSKSLLAVDDWSQAKGHAVFNCDGCELGDNYARMQLGEPFDDIPFSYLTFDELSARADFGDGHMHLTSRWRSPDFELDGRVDATLAKTAADSRLDGCVVFRPTDVLRERDPKLHALVAVTGANTNEAGWFMIAIGGTLGDMKALARTCQP
jgi:hypothetical protein